jgi:diguanylate cyclase (GGDEF)-like protein
MTFPTFPQPDREQDRLAALRRLAGNDMPAGDDFTFLTSLAATLCGTPYAALTLVDAERVHVIARTGLDVASLPRSQCYSALAVLDAGITEIPDLARDARTAAMTLTTGTPGMRRYAAAPLLTDDGLAIGTLAVLDTQPGALTAPQRMQLAGLARQAMALLAARADAAALRAARQELEQVAIRDELTGLLNRRALLHRLQFEAARARRFRTPLSAVLLDIDGIAAVSAECGHPAGERILAAVGKLVGENIRMIDLAGRYDATRLCLLLPNTPQAGARKLADTLAGRIAAQEHAEGARRLRVRAVSGVAAFDHMGVDDADTLLQAAEAALAAAHR